MSIDTNQAQNQEVTATETQSPNVDTMSYSDYERMRRGLPIETKADSAPQGNPGEQKKSAVSETAKTEEESDLDDELDDESNDSEKDKPKKKGGFQRRIDKLNARYSEERQRREALESRLAQLERAGGPKEEPKVESKPNASDKPSADNFETHAEYVEALTDWKIEQREKTKLAEQEKTKLLSEQDKLIKSHFERVKSFAEKTDDFQDVLTSVDDIPPSPAIQEIILSSENGPELMYELAKNRAEYERICGLSPLAAAREIGKIETKLASISSEEKKPEPKKITSAPKPIEPVGSSGSGNLKKSPEEMSFSEYEKHRREQMRRKGR